MATAAERIAALEKLVKDLSGRVEALEAELAPVAEATVPAVDTVQDDVRKLAVAERGRQRPRVQRIRRADGRVVQRVVKPS